jgi:hypothetical protein
MAKQKIGITLEAATLEAKANTETAVAFMLSEFSVDWAVAEDYINGGSSVPTAAGRSTAVKTVVADTIRTALPSIMRTLMHSNRPVNYIPTNISHAAVIEQQELFVQQRFAASGGYFVLQNAIQESLRLKAGPIRTTWVESPTPRQLTMYGVTASQVSDIEELPNVDINEITYFEPEQSPVEGDMDVPPLYNVFATQTFPHGSIVTEAFPIYAFFINSEATKIEDAKVHGLQRTVTVAKAIEMGLDHDDWRSLTATSKETGDYSDVARTRRGYQPTQDMADSKDITAVDIMLTETYCWFDIKKLGYPQLYLFYFGGNAYEYLHHEEIDDYEIDLLQHDPIPFSAIGRSISDITEDKQDIETSLLRAMLDNAHASNNPRLAGDPSLIDFADLMNPALGAPIKSRGPVQVVDIPFTAAGLLPLVLHIEQDTEQRTGFTKASTGLDANAMQSTDAQAVQNTIAMAKGQAELMVRNIVQTAIIGIFKKMLRLSISHLDPIQVIQTKGVVLPVNLTGFSCDLAAVPNVGLGTTSPEQRLAGLQFVLEKQESIMATMGLDNPFTSLEQIYNTIEDLTMLFGLTNPGRYFKVVTPEVEKAIKDGQAQDEAAAAESGKQNTPMDPSQALLQMKGMDAQVSQLKITADAQNAAKERVLKARIAAGTQDIARDKLVQEAMIAANQLKADTLAAKIAAAQDKNNDQSEPTASAGRSEASSKKS